MKSYNRNNKKSSSSPKTQNNISFGLNLNIKRQSNTNIALYGTIGSLLLVFATIIIGFVLNRHGYYDLSIRNIQNHQIIFISSLFTGIIFSILYAIITKTESYTQFKTKRNNISFSLLITLFYIFLAMAIEYMAQKLDFSEALINVLRHRTVSPALIPMLIFIFSSIISFLSGSFLFTITGVLPFAIRIISLNMTDPLIVDNLLFAAIGSVISGATFGDMNSPFSLNFIISTVISLMFIFIDRNQHSIMFKFMK
jgi:Na+/H+ antiporter NhaC